MRATEACLLFLIACGGTEEPEDEPQEVGQDGRYAVTTQGFQVTDAARTRELSMRLYAPTDAAPASLTLPDLVDVDQRDALAPLVSAAPSGCPTASFAMAADAPVLEGTWPLLVYSHCHECLGVSGASVARRMASHGYAVLTVDHAGNTLWNKLDGDGIDLDVAGLDLREADIAFALDVALAGDLGLDVDADVIGVVGHSYGGATAARMGQNDARVKAFVSMAAPLVNPLMQGVEPANLSVPVGMLLAVEDNSITEVGNTLMRDQFDELPGPASKLEVEDAGHWSFSDLTGVHADFMPGCGEDERQTNGELFTYLDAGQGRAVAMDFTEAFFRWHLGGEAVAEEWLSERAERR